MTESKLPIKLQLPSNFLDEEYRSDFLVTSQIKSIWAVELDLLNEFKNVCKQHSITWWMDSGSLIGTVRHHGFIPWDDDIDILVPRKDYDRLCEIAPLYFKHPYFFQTELTDHGSMRGHAQLRNSLTTGILNSEKQKKLYFNQGIFIDIFPLDAVPDNDEDYKKHIQNIQYLKDICVRRQWQIIDWRTKNRRNFILLLFNRIKGYLLDTILYNKYGNRKNYLAFEKEVRKYCDVQTKRLGNLVLTPHQQEYVWFRSDFEDTLYREFEFLDVPIPIGYRNRLSIEYGNWEVPIISGSLHGEVLFDANKPYTEYIDC